MREIILDTETTGIRPEDGHRVVEIGAVELIDTRPTGRTYHQYINPERDMPEAAYKVHGLSAEFLADFPTFDRIASAFLEFIGDSPLVAHNAPFDLAHLNAELTRAGHPPLDPARAVDTLELARRKFPGAGNSLDALCRRYSIDLSARDEYHGALVDCHLLAAVYFELVGGQQPDFALDPVAAADTEQADDGAGPRYGARPRPLAPRLTDRDIAAHDAFVAELGPDALWTSLKTG